MFSHKCKKECSLKNNIYENLNRYINKFITNQKIKLYSLYIFKFQISSYYSKKDSQHAYRGEVTKRKRKKSC